MVAIKVEEEEKLLQQDGEDTISMEIGEANSLLDPLERNTSINDDPSTVVMAPEQSVKLPHNEDFPSDDSSINASNTPDVMAIDPGLVETDLVYEVDDVALLQPPEQEYEFKPSHLPWKKVLMVTGLWFPRTWMKRLRWKVVVYSVQFVITALLFSYFVSESGILGRKWVMSTETNVIFPFTVAHWIIWEFRWLLTYILGIKYGHSRHLEKFVAHLKLPKSMMRKITILQVLYLLLLLFVVLIIPSVLHWFELNKGKHFLKPLLDSIFFFMYRVVTIPSFCMVTYLLYLNGCAIRTLGGRLYRTSDRLGIQAAKRAVLVTKRIISDTEAALQYYLLFHFLLILVAAFTGIFSCVERLEFRSVQKSNEASFSVQQPSVLLQPGDVVKLLNLQQQILQLSPQSAVNPAGPMLKSNTSMMIQESAILPPSNTTSFPAQPKPPSLPLLDVMKGLGKGSRVFNLTAPSTWTTIPKFLDSSHVVMVSICSMCEVLVLYLVPIFLILWQNKCLREVRNNVTGLDTVIQMEGGYVFQSEDKKQDVVKYLEIVQPVRVWGYEVSIYQAIFFTCLAQIVTLTLKTVITKIDKDL